MASDKPTRLRRTEIGRTPPPPAAIVSAGVAHDRPPAELAAGEVVSGTSHPGATAATAIGASYRDAAEVPKGSGAPPHPGGPPFELTK